MHEYDYTIIPCRRPKSNVVLSRSITLICSVRQCDTSHPLSSMITQKSPREESGQNIDHIVKSTGGIPPFDASGVLTATSMERSSSERYATHCLGGHVHAIYAFFLAHLGGGRGVEAVSARWNCLLV
jgi:hypothetical protein